MQKWNINFNRILKVASCSVVIFTLLLASVFPANAAVYGMTLQDWIVRTEVFDNGDVEIDYRPNSIPYHAVYTDGVVFFQGSAKTYSCYETLHLDVLRWHLWPVGYKYYAGDPASYGVIDISDFKAHSTIKLSIDSKVTLNFWHYSEKPGSSELVARIYYYLFFWDKNGQPITGLDKYEAYSYNLEELAYPNGDSDTEFLFKAPWEFTIPNNAVYMAPCIQATFELPGHDAGVQLSSLRMETDGFTIKTSYNSILEDSETLKSINKNMEDVNNQLGDLNDKADTIINGSDEQWDQTQDRDEAMQDAEDSLEDQLDQLDELEDFDTSTVFGTINEFLEADGWKDIRMLLAPLLDWTHAATLMLFVFAFSTLRILLLGR